MTVELLLFQFWVHVTLGQWYFITYDIVFTFVYRPAGDRVVSNKSGISYRMLEE